MRRSRGTVCILGVSLPRSYTQQSFRPKVGASHRGLDHAGSGDAGICNEDHDIAPAVARSLSTAMDVPFATVYRAYTWRR